MKNTTGKLWTKDFIIVMIACSGISFCNYFFSSTLPIYAKNITGTSIYAGLIMTVYTLAALVSRPLTGYLNDRIGRVRMLIIGAALCAVACFLYKYASVIVFLIVFRIFHGIGFGIHSTSGATVAADIIPKERMGEGLGIFGLYGTIASAIAPGIALAIIGDGDTNSQFTPLFMLSVGISIVCMFLDSRIRYERGDKKTAGKEPTAVVDITEETVRQPPRTFLGFEAGVILPAVIIICVFVAYSSVSAFLTLYAKEEGLGNIGLFFTFTAIGMFLSRALLGKVADKRGADILVIPSLVLLVLCYAAIPFVGRIGLFVIGFPVGLAQGAICPAVNTLMFRRCTRRRRGTAAAAYFSSIDLGIGLGALMFGVIEEYFGYSILFWLAAVFAAAAVVIYSLSLTKKKSEGRFLS